MRKTLLDCVMRSKPAEVRLHMLVSAVYRPTAECHSPLLLPSGTVRATCSEV